MADRQCRPSKHTLRALAAPLRGHSNQVVLGSPGLTPGDDVGWFVRYIVQPGTEASMDDKVSAVLELYHQRMREEGERMRSGRMGAGDWRDQVLLAVGPDTGRLINILARSLKAPHILELGTSYGYSGIWLADAARATGGRLTTMELQDYKSAYAKDMSTKAGLAEQVDFKVGDAVAMIEALPAGIDFVLVDLWKDLYVPCLEAFYPKLNSGAIIVADNMIRPGGDDVKRYAEVIRAKPKIASVLLPVGSGIEISRFDGAL
jgi:predicted O-methyltransferase YrrM